MDFLTGEMGKAADGYGGMAAEGLQGAAKDEMMA